MAFKYFTTVLELTLYLSQKELIELFRKLRDFKSLTNSSGVIGLDIFYLFIFFFYIS